MGVMASVCGPIRSSKVGKWRAFALLGVHVLIAVHIAHWMVSGESLSPLEPSEAMEYSKHGIVNAGLVFFAAMIVLTAVFGRFFCGWACHIVALQDACRWLLLKLKIRPKPFRSRFLIFVPLLAFTYMFVYPWVVRVWAQKETGHHGPQWTTTEFWATFPGWATALLTFFVCGFAIVYFLGAKGFCTYGCPYGAIFGLADSLALGRIRVSPACEGCGHCTAVCSSNVKVHQEVRDYGMVVDAGCMKCMDCVSVCPKDALSFGFGKPSLFASLREGVAKPAVKTFDFSLWEELYLLAVFALGFFGVRGQFPAAPFLFSLGFAAIWSYFALMALRLFYRPQISLQRTSLKKAGKFRPIGFLFLAAMATAGLLSFHGSFLKYHMVFRDLHFSKLENLRQSWFQTDPGQHRLTPEQRSRIESGSRHSDWIDSFAILPQAQNDLDRAWFGLFSGRPDDFASNLNRVIRLEPGEPGLWILLGYFEAWRGRLPACFDAFREAKKLDASSTQAYLDLARNLTSQQRLGEAEQVYSEALEQHDRPEEVHFQRGVLALVQENRQVALDEFSQALEINPRLIPARENLAGLYCERSEYDRGIREYEEVLRQQPDRLATRMLLARALRAAKKYSRAEEELQKLLRQTAGSDLVNLRRETYLLWSQVAAEQGQTARAAELRAEARK